MRTSSELRATARQRLRGNWGMAVGVTLIASVILQLITYISNFSTIYSMARYMSLVAAGYVSFNTALGYISSISNSTSTLLSLVINIVAGGALAYGLAAFNLELSRGGNSTVGTLFEGFKVCLGKSIVVNIIRGVFIFLWMLLMMVVIFVVVFIMAFLGIATGNEGFAIIIMLLAVLATIAILICSFIIINRYALVYYLMRDCDEADAMAYIRQSKELMKGKCTKLLRLQLSFIGWALLSGFTFGIGALFLNPYINASYAQFYEDCLQDGRMNGKMTYLRVRGEGMNMQGYDNPYQNPGYSQQPDQNQGYSQNPYQNPYDNNNGNQ